MNECNYVFIRSTEEVSDMSATTDYRIVTLPGSDEHGGWHRMTVPLDWTCPQCGGPRGEPYKGLSFDGSRRLAVDHWDNPCGHIDYYRVIRNTELLQEGRKA
jgi:hypothetical protein